MYFACQSALLSGQQGSTLQLKIKRKLLEKVCTFEERCKKEAPVARAGKLVSALRTAPNASFPVVTRFRQKRNYIKTNYEPVSAHVAYEANFKDVKKWHSIAQAAQPLTIRVNSAYAVDD